MTTLLSVQNLTKQFTDSRFFINDVSFEVNAGEIVALIGKNGSGKSTLIRMITGSYTVDSGQINFFGKQVTPKDTAYKNDIGVVFDAMNFPKKMTILKLEKVFQALYQNWDSNYFFNLIKQFELPAEQLVKDFSRGMSMKLIMAAALSHETKLLILDEATAGLDAASRDEIQEEIEKFVHQQKHGVLLTSHIAEDIERLATHLIFIKNGEIFAKIEKKDLFEHYSIVKCEEAEFDKLEYDDVLAAKEHLGEIEAVVIHNARTAQLPLQPIQHIDEVNKIILRGEYR